MMTIKAYLNSLRQTKGYIASQKYGRPLEWVIYPKKADMHLF